MGLVSSDVHTDSYLSNFALAYGQELSNLPASRGDIFPFVRVNKDSGKYIQINKADWFRVQAGKRGMTAEAPTIEFGTSDGTYSVDKYSAGYDLAWEVRDNADNQAIVSRQMGTRFIVDQVHLAIENDLVDQFFDGSLWATDSTPSNLWSDYSASTPLSDMDTAVNTVHQNTGFMPNTLVLGWQVFQKLKRHPDMLNWLQRLGGGAGKSHAAESDIAAATGIERVIVGKGIKNSAVEGAAAASMSYLYGKHALVCYVDPNPGVDPQQLRPTGAVLFRRQFQGQDFHIARWDEEARHSEHQEGTTKLDFGLVATDLGYFFDTCIA